MTDLITQADQYLHAADIPVASAELRAWFDAMNIPVPVGVQPLMDAVRRAIIAAGDAGHAAGYTEAVAALRDDERYRNWWTPPRANRDPDRQYWTPTGRRHLADYLEATRPTAASGEPS